MADVHIWFWVWVSLAVILFVAEIFTAGFFLLPFGLGATAAAILEYLGVGIGWQWVAFLGVSAVSLIGLRRFAERVTHKPPQDFGVARLVGRTGLVVEALVPHSAAGTVRIDREEWRADEADDQPLPVGTRVIVERIEGAHLVVRTADKPEESER